MHSFKCSVEFRPGKANIAYSLSRLCLTEMSYPFEPFDFVHQEYARPVAVREDEENIKLKEGIQNNIWK